MSYWEVFVNTLHWLFVEKTPLHLQLFVFYIVIVPAIAVLAWLMDIARSALKEPKNAERRLRKRANRAKARQSQ